MTDRESDVDLSSVFGFPLDVFQLKAIQVIDAGESVVVSAPTGSGKTVVAEYAIMRALADSERSFYTTPIKALSNQKFNDLVAMFGRERVGLLTGDNVINADAPIVVMTTEVLRNMLYARSEALSELTTVILDEVHFIQDAYRGPVWEEVIIHLPQAVQLICLSATVSNAPEVAEWMSTVRGQTRYVVEDRRPVELEPLVMISDRSGQDELLSIFSGSAINPRLLRLTETVNLRKGARKPVGRRPLVSPRRSDVIAQLRQHDLLPTIYFIFSRQGCDEAAAAAARELPSLTTPEQRSRIATIIEERTALLAEEDLDALGFEGFRLRLEAGIAAHHAGMVPPFKEIVEACFVEGLIKVVFATETLAVGINMPARSVVIDKLTKFTGEHHEFLSAAQFTQLTGRAGRRGLDDKGHAVLLWSPFVTTEQMAGLASSRSFRLTSSFRPTYNMAVNLVRSYPRDTARHLLNLSLAQFQSDRDVVKLETRLDKKIQELRVSEGLLHSPHGTPDDYLALVSAEDRALPRKMESVVDKAISDLRPGAVIHVQKGNYSGMSTVLSTTRRAKGWKVSVLTARRSLLQLTSEDFTDVPTPVLSIDLPQPFTPTRQDFQKKTVERMTRSLRKRNIDSSRPRTSSSRGTALEQLEDELRMDEDFDQRIIAARRVLRLRREVPHIQEQVDRHTSSISRTFDRVLDILQSWDYVSNWALTPKGEVLARLFHESDLLIAECLHRGLLDELDPPALAALASVFVYEHRSSEPAPAPWFPSKDVRSKWRSIEAISTELRTMESSNHLPPHRAPHPSFVSVAYSWAAGDGFSDIIIDEDLSGGDFVRTMKQLIDLLRQFGIASPEPATRRSATAACELLLRGVVQASSAFGEAP
ncbi:MAG: DEAD/DEAH box helicase [Actinomycetota bacterium]